MQARLLPILAALLVLLAVTGVARYLSASARQRSALSVVLVVLGLVTAFFVFYGAGSWLRTHRAQPRPHASVFIGSSVAGLESSGPPASIARPNPSLHRKTHSRLQRLRSSGELKR
jgi:hypothetical protein